MIKYLNQKISNTYFDGNVLTVSAVGEHHTKRNIPNQDAVGFFGFEDKLAFVTADGLGSCSCSNIGSQKAVSVIENLIKENIDAWESEQIRDEIILRWVESFDKNINDFSTTLRFVVFTANNVVVGSIGDGLSLIQGNTIMSIKSEDTFTNCTYALCSETTNFIVKKHPIESNTYSLALMTDGVANEINPKLEKDFLKYYSNIIFMDTCQEETCNWIEHLSESNGDDKTILVAKIKYKNS